jgi:hypothetical protein
LAEFSTTDFTRTKISNSDEASLNGTFTSELGEKGNTNGGWKGEDSAEWKREVSEEWRGEMTGEEWKREDAGEEEWGRMSGRGSALMMSSLHRRSPDRSQKDEYPSLLPLSLFFFAGTRTLVLSKQRPQFPIPYSFYFRFLFR